MDLKNLMSSLSAKSLALDLKAYAFLKRIMRFAKSLTYLMKEALLWTGNAIVQAIAYPFTSKGEHHRRDRGYVGSHNSKHNKFYVAMHTFFEDDDVIWT